MPIEYGYADILTNVQWDTLRFEAGTRIAPNMSYKLFTKPVAYEKTFLDTSMYRINRLPEPQHMNVTHSQVAFGALNHPDDNAAFRSAAYYEFIIGQKCFDKAPLARFTKELSSVEDFALLAQEAAFAITEGAQLIGNHVEYRIGDNSIGHHILQGQSFGVTLTIDETIIFKQPFKFVFMLEGVLSRSVQ